MPRVLYHRVTCGQAEDRNLWPRSASVKILLTDPPYGINQAWKKTYHGGNGVSTTRDGVIPQWDKQAVSYELLKALVDWADLAIVWGGNFYPMPPAPCWLVWDKLQSNRGSDAELAWTNTQIKGVKVFRMSRIDAYFNKRDFPKVHPAEKPVRLMFWCLSLLRVARDAIVFDPFCGCGASLIAAQRLGYEYSGIDQDKNWVIESQRRLENA